MKKFLFFITFSVFISSLLSAQKYFPLPDSGAVWTSAKINTNGIYVENIKFLISSDTVIKGKAYKKVYSTNDSFIKKQNLEYFGCIREDGNRKWNTIIKNDTFVLPLYDFSLKVDDTILSYIYFPLEGGAELMLKVLSVDSILIDNEYRKKINLQSLFLYKTFYTSWIEGIGSLNQLFLPLVIVGDYDYKLLCFEENGALKYHNSPNSNCYYVSIRDNQNSKLQNLKAYPNPAISGQYVKIDDIKPGTYHLSIMDLYGRNYAEFSFTNIDQITFKAMDKPGIYFIKLIGPDNFYGYFKLVVE